MDSILNSVKTALAVSENLKNCEIVPMEESKKGEGVIAVINRVILTGTDSKNLPRKYNLILKTASVQEIYRTSSPINEMYLNEIYAYETVLPTLRKTSQDFGINFVKFPRCYQTNGEAKREYLVLEDLKSDGFKMWDKQKTMDDDHLRVVLENLARFHAASIYLKKKRGEIWQKLIGGLIDVPKKFFCETEFCDAVIDLGKTLDHLFDDRDDALERFKAFRDSELKEFMCNFCRQTDSDSIIVHGDLWSNNILFKYGDSSKPNKPTDIALLDYQAIRLSSVTLDLSYFLYVSASKQAMSTIETYLDYYYEKLAQNLQKMNLDPDLTLPKSSLSCQWKRYNKFGLSMALVTLHGVNSDSDEFPNLEQVMEGGKGFWFALNFESRHEGRYQERIRDVVLHFIEKDYIRKLDGCLWSRKR